MEDVLRMIERMKQRIEERKARATVEHQFPLQKSEEEWRAQLSPKEYHILRQAGTEKPWTGEYTEHFQPGAYVCAACGHELFRSQHKFAAHCGWPSFFATAAQDRVVYQSDFKLGYERQEVLCAHCGSHLGHMFDDGPEPTGDRYCINSLCLKFVPDENV